MAIYFRTDDYELSHGKPRGRGSWAFSLKRDPILGHEIFWTPGSTTYTEAKRLARQHYAAEARRAARLCDHVNVYVLP
jgi:hypothetical protein